MESSELLARIFEDLKKIQQVCDEGGLEDLPAIAIQYLAANDNTLRRFVTRVYSELNESQRRGLVAEHRELSSTAVHADFMEIALTALDNAKRIQKTRLSLLRVTTDHLKQLLYVLKFVKYCSPDTHNFNLQLSPIAEAGLQRPFGNFESLSKEEFEAVPWHLADVVYADEKERAIADCKKLGLDLEAKSVLPADPAYWSAIVASISRLADLLRYKMECDLAAVLLKFQYKKRKYHNTIDRRLDYESGPLIEALRKGAAARLSQFWGQPLTDSEEFSIENDVLPFLDRAKEVRSQFSSIQPRTSVYHAVAALVRDSSPPVPLSQLQETAPVIGEGEKKEGMLRRLLWEVVVAIVASLVIEPTLKVLNLDHFIPLLPYVWFVILAFLTLDALRNLKKQRLVSNRLAQFHHRFAKYGKAMSFILVGLAVTVLFRSYWWAITRIFPARSVTIPLVRKDALAHGLVVDEEERPVSGIRIGVDGYPKDSAVTTADGEFTFPAHAAQGEEVRLRVYDERFLQITAYYFVSPNVRVQVKRVLPRKDR